MQTQMVQANQTVSNQTAAKIHSSPEVRTFPEVLKGNAVHTDRAVTFMRANGEERRVSFPDLWAEAKKRAHALFQLGLNKGDRVAIVLPEPDEFVLTFMACLTAGVVAVPMYPPQTLAKMGAYGDTVRHILSASGARILITNAALQGLITENLSEGTDAPSTKQFSVVLESEIRGSDDNAAEPAAVTLDDLAFLQFTSGSTSKPKGVMVTFGNLAANAHAIMVDGLKSTPADKGVSWLPLYHDMGLIGFVVAPLYTLVQVMFMPTMAFIRRPSIWLDAIHRFRGTITFAPNFAYALATRAVTEAQASGWDLSCMRALGCGAEPIQAEVMKSFLDRFSKNGLAPSSVLPSYGMAEATLAITFHGITDTLRTDRIDVASMRKGVAKPSVDGGMELVGCGRPFPHHELSIMTPSGSPLGERQVGEIWVKGPSVTGGYFDNAEATEETFGGGWLRTGDLGYLADGELFICGRAKDLIILNGKNYYPQDMEVVVSKAVGVRDGQCVAFSRLDERGGEQCVIVAEGRIGPRAGSAAQIISEIIQLVRAEIGIVVGEVHLIKRGTLPKTSSGKVRRREAKKRLELGELELLGEGEPDSIGADSIGRSGTESARPPSMAAPATRPHLDGGRPSSSNINVTPTPSSVGTAA